MNPILFIQNPVHLQIRPENSQLITQKINFLMKVHVEIGYVKQNHTYIWDFYLAGFYILHKNSEFSFNIHYFYKKENYEIRQLTMKHIISNFKNALLFYNFFKIKIDLVFFKMYQIRWLKIISQ